MAEKKGSGRAVNRMYNYMSPSYVGDDLQQAASYRAVLDALVENSSAHGLPTFYKAKGNAGKRRFCYRVYFCTHLRISPGHIAGQEITHNVRVLL